MAWKKPLGLLVSVVLWFGAATSQADVVTMLPDGASSIEPHGTSTDNGNIVLTFGREKVVIHDSSRSVPGKQLTQEDVPLSELFILRDRRPVSDRSGYDVIYRHFGFCVVRVADARTIRDNPDIQIEPIRNSRVVTEAPAGPTQAPDPEVQALLSRLDVDSYTTYMSTLVDSAPTRASCSPRSLSAKATIEGHFRRMGFQTGTMAFRTLCRLSGCKSPLGFNVLAVKPGRLRPSEILLAGAHFDSTSKARCRSAPGANDNASGTAGLMEIARLFSTIDTEATVVLVAFGGEEIGLLGSRRLAQRLERSGLKASVKAFVVLDMVSFWEDNYSVLIEGSDSTAAQQEAIQTLAGLGQTYTNLGIETSIHYGGSDHAPLLDIGLAGALLIEADWDRYRYYHTERDTMEHQDAAYGLEMVKLAAALLATCAGIAE